jgi:hypothetical protein
MSIVESYLYGIRLRMCGTASSLFNHTNVATVQSMRRLVGGRRCFIALTPRRVDEQLSLHDEALMSASNLFSIHGEQQ